MELRARGQRSGRKRIARLMRAQGLRACRMLIRYVQSF
jgi:transposase InsO family protein